MDISYIGKIREMAMKVANNDVLWSDLATPLGMSITPLEDLFSRSGIIDMAGNLYEYTSYADIMFTLCLYFSMRPGTQFTKTAYHDKRTAGVEY